jgi:hypothetical protein
MNGWVPVISLTTAQRRLTNERNIVVGTLEPLGFVVVPSSLRALRTACDYWMRRRARRHTVILYRVGPGHA